MKIFFFLFPSNFVGFSFRLNSATMHATIDALSVAEEYSEKRSVQIVRPGASNETGVGTLNVCYLWTPIV